MWARGSEGGGRPRHEARDHQAGTSRQGAGAERHRLLHPAHGPALHVQHGPRLLRAAGAARPQVQLGSGVRHPRRADSQDAGGDRAGTGEGAARRSGRAGRHQHRARWSPRRGQASDINSARGSWSEELRREDARGDQQDYSGPRFIPPLRPHPAVEEEPRARGDHRRGVRHWQHDRGRRAEVRAPRRRGGAAHRPAQRVRAPHPPQAGERRQPPAPRQRPQRRRHGRGEAGAACALPRPPQDQGPHERVRHQGARRRRGARTPRLLPVPQAPQKRENRAHRLGRGPRGGVHPQGAVRHPQAHHREARNRVRRCQRDRGIDARAYTRENAGNGEQTKKLEQPPRRRKGGGENN